MPQFTFHSTVIHWHGPSPYFFAPLPAEHVAAIRAAAKLVSYGWGVIPVEASVGGTSFTTSLFPKDEGYLLPLKDKVRKARRLHGRRRDRRRDEPSPEGTQSGRRASSTHHPVSSGESWDPAVPSADTRNFPPRHPGEAGSSRRQGEV